MGTYPGFGFLSGKNLGIPSFNGKFLTSAAAFVLFFAVSLSLTASSAPAVQPTPTPAPAFDTTTVAIAVVIIVIIVAVFFVRRRK